MKAVAWTEQRLKQSARARLSAELLCWKSQPRLCTALSSAWLLAAPASASFGKLGKGQGLPACDSCLPFASRSRSRAWPKYCRRGSGLWWSLREMGLSSNCEAGQVGSWQLGTLFLSCQNSSTEVWWSCILFLTPKLAYL